MINLSLTEEQIDLLLSVLKEKADNGDEDVKKLAEEISLKVSV